MLRLIAENNSITYDELALAVNKSRSTVYRVIKSPWPVACWSAMVPTSPAHGLFVTDLIFFRRQKPLSSYSKIGSLRCGDCLFLYQCGGLSDDNSMCGGANAEEVGAWMAENDGVGVGSESAVENKPSAGIVE